MTEKFIEIVEELTLEETTKLIEIAISLLESAALPDPIS